jgi:ribosomal protein S18 acetylase RimI-like enzyme
MKQTYRTRSYRHPDDLAAVLALVRARPASRVNDYPSLADLQELFCRAEIQANSCLWFANGKPLAGFAFNDHYPDFSGMSFEFAPQSAEIGSEMIHWCLENFRQHRQDQATQIQLSVAPENTGQIQLLQAHGFRQENWHLVVMTRSLSDPIPSPQLPEGFSIRNFRGEDELDDWVALHRAAFGTQNLTAEHRRTWMQGPGYTPALDLVAVAPNGTLAAYGYYSIHPEENEHSEKRTGRVDSAGTLPVYRRMGLARALLLAGLPILKASGMETASLTTASYSAAMQQAAYRAGFRQTGKILYYASDAK